MPYLVAAVVFACLLGLLNLLLTLAVIRRLREHTTRLNTLGTSSKAPELLPAGAALPDFTTRSIDDQAVTAASGSIRFLAFLSTTCSSCHTQLPALREFLTSGRHGGGPENAVLVVCGPENSNAEQFVDELRTIGMVVREPFDGPVGQAFSAHVYPAFYLFDNNVVSSATVAVAELRESVPA